MDRYTNQDGSAFQPGKVMVDVEFVAGSSGAVPTSLAGYVRAEGIASMDLAATGVYTVHLQDAYFACTRATFQVVQATYDASHACNGDPIDDDVSDGTDPLVTFQAYDNATGAAAAVTASDTVKITLELTRLAPT